MKTNPCVFLLSLLLAALYACVPGMPTWEPTVEMGELRDRLIDVSVFPSGWRQDGEVDELYYQETPREAQEGLLVQFVPSDGEARATYEIYSFRDSRVAARTFRRGRGLGFYDADRVTPWESPEWMTYQSPVADQYRFACADYFGSYSQTSSKNCVFVGQYGRYIAGFSIGLSPPESITNYVQLWEQVLQAIDARMELYGKE